ncbi:MAG: DUF4080 domain-containing protein [Clostridia bacterium]|nr:DUF4080 domain-containing protein [Clostridia bacterium]
MKVIIGCLNSKYIHASLAPWCLLAGVKAFVKNDYDIKVLESTINGNPHDFAQKIISENPQVVSFSCYIWNITGTLEICKEIKENLNCKIILGGPEVAYRPQDILEKYDFIDFVLSGEGEWNFPLLLDNINDNLNVVDGLTYRENNEIITNPEKEYTDTPPSPYSEDFYNNLKGRIAYIETSRGCPYRCAFCLSGRCSKLRFFDLEQVKEDIINLANSGTQTLKFVDRTFNANSKRANEILTFIKDNYGTKIPENICFHFEIAGDILTEATLEIFSQMPVGAVQLEIGMQSFNEETLAKINRKNNTEKLIKNIKKLLEFGNMHIHIDLIAGLTGENLESFKNSFNIGYSLKAHMLQMGFLKLLYGADMRENPEDFPCEYNENPPYEVISTPWISADEMKTLKNCEDAVDRLYNSGRFLFTLDYLIDEIGISPFDLFNDFGNSVDGTNMRLSDYAVKVYEYFKDKCDEQILREKILCDLLSCSSSVQIPEIFKIRDPLYKKVKKHFIENVNQNMKIAILYSKNEVFAVNQSGKKDFYGRYKGEFYKNSFISEQ